MSKTLGFLVPIIIIQSCSPVITPLGELQNHRCFRAEDPLYLIDFFEDQAMKFCEGSCIEFDVDVMCTGCDSYVLDFGDLLKFPNNLSNFFGVKPDLQNPHGAESQCERIANGDNLNNLLPDQLFQSASDRGLGDP